MTIGEAKKLLSPVRKASGLGHGSPRPIGAHEGLFNIHDKRVITGIYNATGSLRPWGANSYRYTVYDNTQFCSSWAPAVTSAMSLAISIHHARYVNLSIQFLLDCDLIGDPCVARPPLSAYEQFWRRYIPQASRWDSPKDPQRPPYYQLTEATCNAQAGCYPGWQNCPRNLVMTGSCKAGDMNTACPVYFLYNWRAIKSHLWEVGPVTSSILVRPQFFAYDSGVYSGISGDADDVLGMLDVTIIGWGQVALNLGPMDNSNSAMYERWWYVVPHLGKDFGEDCETVFGDETDSIRKAVACDGERSGVMRFNRRVDDSEIESHAAGAVPFNFRPLPERTPRPTGAHQGI
jgi:hypothetical protein